MGPKFARDRNEVITLKHGEFREYHTEFKILDGPHGTREMEVRIASIVPKVEDEYPKLSGDYPRLR